MEVKIWDTLKKCCLAFLTYLDIFFARKHSYGQLVSFIVVFDSKDSDPREALAIRRIFSLVDTITKAKFSKSPNDFKICLFG